MCHLIHFVRSFVDVCFSFSRSLSLLLVQLDTDIIISPFKCIIERIEMIMRLWLFQFEFAYAKSHNTLDLFTCNCSNSMRIVFKQKTGFYFGLFSYSRSLKRYELHQESERNKRANCVENFSTQEHNNRTNAQHNFSAIFVDDCVNSDEWWQIENWDHMSLEHDIKTSTSHLAARCCPLAWLGQRSKCQSN